MKALSLIVYIQLSRGLIDYRRIDPRMWIDLLGLQERMRAYGFRGTSAQTTNVWVRGQIREYGRLLSKNPEKIVLWGGMLSPDG